MNFSKNSTVTSEDFIELRNFLRQCALSWRPVPNDNAKKCDKLADAVDEFLNTFDK